jgi:hypothetical protein
MSKLYFDNITIALCGIFCLASSTAHAEVQGRYTDWLKELLASKSYGKLVNPTLPDSTTEQPDQVTCLETPKERFYIGVAQSMIVKAPLQEVAKVVEDIDQFVDLFPGYAKVKVLSRTPDRIETFWEQRIPVFFIPNVKYEMIYFLSRPDDKTRLYRYQLKDKGEIKESDGFIALEKINEQTTRYFELDFFNADWGALETFAPGRIWKDSVDGLYISDRAIQLKAENPNWTAKQAREAAENTVEKVEKTTHKTPGEACADLKTLQWNQALPGLPLPGAPTPAPTPSPSPSSK